MQLPQINSSSTYRVEAERSADSIIKGVDTGCSVALLASRWCPEKGLDKILAMIPSIGDQITVRVAVGELKELNKYD